MFQVHLHLKDLEETEFLEAGWQESDQRFMRHDFHWIIFLASKALEFLKNLPLHKLPTILEHSLNLVIAVIGITNHPQTNHHLVSILTNKQQLINILPDTHGTCRSQVLAWNLQFRTSGLLPKHWNTSLHWNASVGCVQFLHLWRITLVKVNCYSNFHVY